MIKFVLGKFGQALLSLLGASLVIFLLARATGDPTALMLPPTATAEDALALRAKLGLDLPLWQQYGLFIMDALRLDFGDSIMYRRPAMEVIGPAALQTLRLGSVAFIITAAISIPAGVYAAYRRGTRFDRFVLGGAAAGQALPSFFVGSILIAVFAVQLGLLPTSGAVGWQSMVLPVTTIVIFALAGLTRLTRSSTLETLGTEYVKFARVKGVPERQVLWKHSFRNASLSVLTLSAIVLVSMLSGSIIVETVFAWPGLGRAVVVAVQQRDFPVVQLIVLLLSIAYILANFIVDILYAVLNPRVRIS